MQTHPGVAPAGIDTPGGVARNVPGADIAQPALKSGAAVLALDAAILTVIGSSIRGNLQLIAGVPITFAAFVVSWAAATRRRPDRPLSSVYFLLAATAAVGLMVPAPGSARWYEVLCRLHPAIGIVAIGVVAGGTPRQRRGALLFMAISATVLYLLGPLGVPSPDIDVWYWIQATGHALVRGVHPYTVNIPDPYHGAYDFGSTPNVFPYMPATVLLSAPAIAALGDYRFALALCLPITLLLLMAAASKLESDPELTTAAALALVLQPRGAQMVTLGFPEFFLVAIAALFVFLAASGRRVAEALAFFLLPVIKQYVAAPVLLYAAFRRRLAPVVAGAAVAAATIVPFLVWDARATTGGMLYLVRAPIAFRIDSTALTALIARLTGFTSPRWLGIAAQFAAAMLAGWALRDRGLGGLLLASAISLLACFLLATQAFLNYYAFVAALFVFAAVALSARRPVTWA